MVTAGFYYTGQNLIVKFCACKSIVTCFRKGDDLFGATTHHSNCPFVREKENGAAAAASSAVRHSNGFVSDTNSTDSSSLLPTIAATLPQLRLTVQN